MVSYSNNNVPEQGSWRQFNSVLYVYSLAIK